MTYRPDDLGYTRDDRLYRLLTRFQREVDATAGGQALRALTRVMAEGLNQVEDDIERLLDNAFIETCEPWAVPYVAAIVGFEATADASPEDGLSTAQREALIRALAPRRLAANTIRHRRRKGTLRVLEDLAWDLAGWNARATEQGSGVLRAAHVQHVADGRNRLADLRDAGVLDRLDGPFSATARLFDAQPNAGDAVDGVTLFVWRTRVHGLRRARARRLPDDLCSDSDTYAYTFSPIGEEAPLYQNPLPSRDPTGIATDLEVPAAIRPLPFRLHTADYYGEGLSIAVYRYDPAGTAGGPYELIPVKSVVPADLGPGAAPVELDWGELAIDPVRGRMLWKPATPPASDEETQLWSAHYRGATDDVGGGYPIDPGEPPAIALPAGEDPKLVVRAAVRRVEPAGPEGPGPGVPHDRRDKQLDDVGKRLDAAPAGAVGVVEVGDDEVYHEEFHARVKPGRSLIVRARAGRLPVIWPREHPDHRPHVEGAAGGRLAFEGIWFARGRLAVRGAFDLLSFRHSTFVPGGTGERGHGPSIELDEFRGALDVRRCVLGPIVVRHERRGAAPPRMSFADSAIDGGAEPSACEVIHGGGRHAVAYARASFDRCTVVGTARVHALDHAEDSIFTGPLIVARRQRGRLEWCYVARGSQTPARVRCQPDMVIAAARAASQAEAAEAMALVVGAGALGVAAEMAARGREAEDTAARGVEPRFLSTRFGDADYLVLADDAPPALLQGAEDGSEMGVHHDLFFAPRAAALAALADEYTPAGFSVEIVYVHG